jgi:hypothetical protein
VPVCSPQVRILDTYQPPFERNCSFSASVITASPGEAKETDEYGIGGADFADPNKSINTHWYPGSVRDNQGFLTSGMNVCL